jgi:hypothetical protein
MQSDESGSVPRQDLTFWQRNALTIMIVVMGVLFALVIVVQMKT